LGTLFAVGPLLLPAAAARCWTRQVWPAVGLSVAFGVVAGYAGLLVSYHANLPSGPAIVLSAALIYGFSIVAGDQRAQPLADLEGGVA